MNGFVDLTYFERKVGKIGVLPYHHPLIDGFSMNQTIQRFWGTPMTSWKQLLRAMKCDEPGEDP